MPACSPAGAGRSTPRLADHLESSSSRPPSPGQVASTGSRPAMPPRALPLLREAAEFRRCRWAPRPRPRRSGTRPRTSARSTILRLQPVIASERPAPWQRPPRPWARPRRAFVPWRSIVPGTGFAPDPGRSSRSGRRWPDGPRNRRRQTTVPSRAAGRGRSGRAAQSAPRRPWQGRSPRARSGGRARHRRGRAVASELSTSRRSAPRTASSTAVDGPVSPV